MDKQTKSKERVKDFGEVFTNPREVNAMLDLVKDESYRIDSTFLEPACGTGNFLVEIIDRKMKTIEKANIVNQDDWESHVLVTVGSIYGIDIQEDNCQESRARMLEIVKEYYQKAYQANQRNSFIEAIKYIMDKNIILGDGLTGLQVGEANKDKPIMFSEWNVIARDNIIRKDFEMNKMIAHNKNEESRKKIESSQGSLFALMGPQPESEPDELEPSKITEYAENSVFSL